MIVDFTMLYVCRLFVWLHLPDNCPSFGNRIVRTENKLKMTNKGMMVKGMTITMMMIKVCI